MKKILLLIIPVLLLICTFSLSQHVFWSFRYDPDYCYLLNGLNLAATHGNIGHFDHPGTPVQIVSAMVIKVTYWMRDTRLSNTMDVLIFPEYYLKRIAFVISFLNIALILLDGFLISKLTRNVLYGLIFQTIPLFSPIIISSGFFRVNAESMIITAMIIFIFLMLIRFFFDKLSSSFSIRLPFAKNHPLILEYSLVWIALTMGFAISVKITTVPLMLIPLFMYKGFRNKLVFIFITIVSFVICTLPIIHHYDYIFSWVTRLFLHTGKYGSGGKDIIDVGEFLSNFLLIIKTQWIFMLILITTALIVVYRWYSKKFDDKTKLAALVVLVQMVGVAMVSKHFSLHYMLPFEALSAISLIFILTIPEIGKLYVYVASLILMAGCTVLNLAPYMVSRRPVFSDFVNQKEYTRVYCQGCDSRLYAYYQGNRYANYAYTGFLQKTYGNQYFYLYANNYLRDWSNRRYNIDSLAHTSKEVLLLIHKRNLKSLRTYVKVKKEADGQYLYVSRKKKNS